MNIPLITPILEAIKGLGGKYIQLQTTKAEGRLTIEAAKAKAEAQILLRGAESVADWERIQATNAGSSWKDEFWTLLIAIPVPLAFIPEMRPVVEDGFQALSTAPEWYLWALGASIGASFGIRTGAFSGLASGAQKAVAAVTPRGKS